MDFCPWVDAEANELAREAGLPEPFPGVENPAPDNGDVREEVLYDYYEAQAPTTLLAYY
jgi:hypothetical protein